MPPAKFPRSVRLPPPGTLMGYFFVSNSNYEIRKLKKVRVDLGTVRTRRGEEVLIRQANSSGGRHFDQIFASGRSGTGNGPGSLNSECALIPLPLNGHHPFNYERGSEVTCLPRRACATWLGMRLYGRSLFIPVRYTLPRRMVGSGTYLSPLKITWSTTLSYISLHIPLVAHAFLPDKWGLPTLSYPRLKAILFLIENADALPINIPYTGKFSLHFIYKNLHTCTLH